MKICRRLRQASLLLLVLVASGGLAAAQTSSGQNPSFNLLNKATIAIRELYFTPAGDANWGRNRLTSPIPAGGSFEARRRIDGNCVFDVRVVFEGGRIEDRRGINTCNSEDVTFGAATSGAARKAPDDPSFRLVNRSTAPIIEAYATPSGTGNWGKNRLDSGSIPAKADRFIHIEKQGVCSFDLRVVLEGGRKLERRHADLCKITDLPVP